MRLENSFRYSIYGVLAVLLLTGAGWLIADWQKDSDEIWQHVAANMLMVHGGAAMLALLLLGALMPVHLARAWRARRNRISGSVMASFNVVLIATAFGLYYLGSDAVRPWMSWIHIVAGFSLAAMLPVHITLGRGNSSASTNGKQRSEDAKISARALRK